MHSWTIGLSLLLCLAPAAAAPPETGPRIQGHGPVYDLADPAWFAGPKQPLRAVFDVGAGEQDAGQVNRRIVTVARFLNLHARAGYPPKKLAAVVVLHGSAARDALDDDGYSERHGVPNPNLPLLAELRRAGVELYLCGQSAAHRGLARDELSGDVEVALSAMTVLLQAQARGYGLIAF